MELPINTKCCVVVIALQLGSILQIPTSLAATGESNCIFNDWGKDVSCRKMELVSMPPLRGPIQILDVSDNQIRQLTNETFSTLPSVEYLDLSNNRLRVIQDGIFAESSKGRGTPRLKYLDLSENEFSKIEDNAFKNLSRLSELYLNDNMLKEIATMVFGDLYSLEILWLSKNSLTHLSRDTFGEKRNLLSLFLDRNKFVTLPDSIFRNCWSLEVISLSGNQLQRVPASLADLPALRYLYLSNNRLIDISPVTNHLWALEALTIDNNLLRCSCNLEQVYKWMIRKGVLQTNSDEICYQSDKIAVNFSTLVIFCQQRSTVGDSDLLKVSGKVKTIIIVREETLVYYNSVLLTCFSLSMCIIMFLSCRLSRKVTKRFKRRRKTDDWN